MEVRKPHQAGVDLCVRNLLAPTWEARGVEILEHDDDLVGPGLDGQRSRYPTGVGTLVRIALVPGSLDLVGPELSFVGAVRGPTARMSMVAERHRVGPTDMLHDHTRLGGSLEPASHELAVTAPQTLHDFDADDRGCARRSKHDCIEFGADLAGLRHQRRLLR